jgi:hypothetical protein
MKAQICPPANTLVDLYTVPSGKRFVQSTMFACPQHADYDLYNNVRVAIAPNGEPDNPKHYVYYNLLLPWGNTFTFSTGITLEAGDVIRVWSDTSYTSFNLFGEEEDV